MPPVPPRINDLLAGLLHGAAAQPHRVEPNHSAATTEDAPSKSYNWSDSTSPTVSSGAPTAPTAASARPARPSREVLRKAIIWSEILKRKF